MVDTLVLETSACVRESSNLSSSTKFRSTEGAGEWSPSRLESGGLVTSQWGSIPPPSAKIYGRQARRVEQRTPNPLLQSSNLWPPATEGVADGGHRTASAASVTKWRNWVRLPGPLPSLRTHSDSVVHGLEDFGCKADTAGRACL